MTKIKCVLNNLFSNLNFQRTKLEIGYCTIPPDVAAAKSFPSTCLAHLRKLGSALSSARSFAHPSAHHRSVDSRSLRPTVRIRDTRACDPPPNTAHHPPPPSESEREADRENYSTLLAKLKFVVGAETKPKIDKRYITHEIHENTSI